MDYDFSNFSLPDALTDAVFPLSASFLENISQMSMQSSFDAVQSATQTLQKAALESLNSSNELISQTSSILCEIANVFSSLNEQNFSEDDSVLLHQSFQNIINFPETIDLKTGKHIIRVKISYIFQIIGILISFLSLLNALCQNLPQHQESCPCLQEHFEEEHSQSLNFDNLPHVVQSPSDSISADAENSFEK